MHGSCLQLHRISHDRENSKSQTLDEITNSYIFCSDFDLNFARSWLNRIIMSYKGWWNILYWWQTRIRYIYFYENQFTQGLS